MNYSDLIMGHFVIDTDAIYREIEVFLDDDINRIAVDCLWHKSFTWSLFSMRRFRKQLSKLDKLSVTSRILEEL